MYFQLQKKPISCKLRYFYFKVEFCTETFRDDPLVYFAGLNEVSFIRGDYFSKYGILTLKNVPNYTIFACFYINSQKLQLFENYLCYNSDCGIR